MYDAMEFWSKGNISKSKEILNDALSGIAYFRDISSMGLMYARILMTEGNFSTAQTKLKNVLFIEPQRIEPLELINVFSKATSVVATESDVHIEATVKGMINGKEYFYTPTDIVKIGKAFYCLDNSNKTLIKLSQALSIESIIPLKGTFLPTRLGKTRDDKLIVLDYSGNTFILDPLDNMKVITRISTPMVAPIDVTLDRYGDLYILDQARSVIEVFSPQFLHLKTIHPFSDTANLVHISFNKNLSLLYVIDMNKKRIAVIDTETNSRSIHFFYTLIHEKNVVPISLEVSPYSDDVFVLWSDGRMIVYNATFSKEIGILQLHAPKEISAFHIFDKQLICLYRRLNSIYSYDVIYSGIGELPWIVGIDPSGFPKVKLYVRVSNAINRTTSLTKYDLQVWENNTRCDILKVEEKTMGIRILNSENNRVNVKELMDSMRNISLLGNIVEVRPNLSDITKAISTRCENILIISSKELKTLINKIGEDKLALIMKIDDIRPIIVGVQKRISEIKTFLYRTNGCFIKDISMLPSILKSLDSKVSEVVFKTNFIIPDSNTRDINVVYRGKDITHLDYIYYLPIRP